MEMPNTPAVLRSTYAPETFDIHSLEDEINADERCGQLLVEFLRHLVKNLDLPPEKASSMVRGTDYFLRDYVISFCRENIFSLRPGQVRKFGGNWYIVRNLEPNFSELESILGGIKAFYRWAQSIGWISPLLADQIDSECALGNFFKKRIQSFWAIEGDGFRQWDLECSLKE